MELPDITVTWACASAIHVQIHTVTWENHIHGQLCFCKPWSMWLRHTLHCIDTFVCCFINNMEKGIRAKIYQI
jgi:hypothetical protein